MGGSSSQPSYSPRPTPRETYHCKYNPSHEHPTWQEANECDRITGTSSFQYRNDRKDEEVNISRNKYTQRVNVEVTNVDDLRDVPALGAFGFDPNRAIKD